MTQTLQTPREARKQAGAVYASATDGSASERESATVELALFAPYNEIVELMAEWTQWKPVPMTKGEDGWWRIQAKLDDGAYQYRYRVKSNSYFALGEMKEVPDPYAFENTEGDPASSILRIKDGQRNWTDYHWKHDDRPLPTNDHLIIYELHVGDFTGTKEKAGTLAQATEKLDYLQQLGVNAIELMPVKEFPGRGWGYSLKTLFGVENSYGTPEDLCRFVDECHGRQMRVILDGVYNHAHADAYLSQIDFEYWFHRNNPDGPDMDWGPKYNYDHFDEKYNVFPARKYVIDSIVHWIEKFHIDGIRFDATRAIKSFDVMKELTALAYQKVQDMKPFLTVAEHIPEDPAISGRERGAPMDAAWHNELGVQLQSTLSGAEQFGHQPNDVKRLTDLLNPATNGYEKGDRTVTFVGNHDYKRPMQVLGEDGKKFGDTAFRRMKLGHGLILTAPGLPMIWMGSEFGMPGEKTLDPVPLDWSLLDNADNKGLLEFHQKLIELRKTVPALLDGDMNYLFIDEENQRFAFRRSSGSVNNESGSCVFVAVNLKDEPVDEFVMQDDCITVGNWWDVLAGWDVNVQEAGKIVTKLGPSELRVFVKR